MAGGTWVAGSVAVLVKPVLNNFQKDIRSQLSGAGLDAVGRDIGADIANPIKTELGEGAETAKRSIREKLSDIGKGLRVNLEKPFNSAAVGAGKGAALAFAGAMTTALKAAPIVIGIGAGILIKDSIAEASNLEQNLGASEAIFGEHYAFIEKRAKEAYKNVGLSQNEYLKSGNVLASMLKNQGVPMDQIAQKTDELIGLSADLSSMYGGTSSEAIEAITAAYRGETDPIEKYGVSLNDATLKQKALDLGIQQTGGSWTAQQRQILTTAIIYDQTAAAQGNFSREQDTLAHKQQVAAAQWANLKAVIGEAFLPALGAVMTFISNKVIPGFVSLADGLVWVSDGIASTIGLLGTGQWTDGIFGLKEDSPVIKGLLAIREAGIAVVDWFNANLLPAFKTVGGFIQDNLVPILAGVGAALVYLGSSFVIGFLTEMLGLLIPPIASFVAGIGWIPVVIALAVGALTWFFTKTETGQKVLASIVDAIKGVWEAIKLIVTGDFKGGIFGLEEDNPIIGALLTIHDVIVQTGDVIKTSLVDGWNAVVKAWQTGTGGDNPVLQFLVQVKNFGTGVWDGIVSAVDKVRTALSSLGGSGSDGLSKFFGAIQWVGSQVGSFLSGVWDLLKGIGSFVAQVVTGVIVPALMDLWNIIANVVGPIVVRLFTDYIGPILGAIGVAFLWLYGNVIGPVLSGLGWLLSNVIGPVFTWLYQSIISPIINAIGAVISFVFNYVVFPVLDALMWVFTTAIPVAAQFLWAVMQTVWNAILAVINFVVPIILTIVDGIVWFFNNVLVPCFNFLVGVVQFVWEAIRVAIAVVVAIVLTYIDAWVWIFQNVLAPVFNWLYNNVILPVWNGIQIAINAVVVWFQTVAWPVISMVITWISDKFELFKQGLGIIWAFIQNNVINPVVSWFQNVVLPAFSNVLQWIKDKFDLFKAGLDIIFAFIKNNIVQPILDWFNNTVLTTFSNVLGWIRDKFDLWKQGIGVIFNFLKNNIVQPVLDFFSGTVQPMFERVLDGVGKAFNTLKDTVEKVWNGIQNTAKAPIKFVVEDVIRDGIVKNYNRVAGTFGVKQIDEKLFTVGFARGGILPGSSTWRQGDDQLVPMRRGEGVTITEALDPYEKARLLSLNKHVLGGGSARSFRARFGEGHARGGLIGDPLDWINDLGGFAKDVISDPKGAFNKLVDKFLGGVPGGGTIKELAKSVPKKMADMIGDSLFGDGGQVPDTGTVPSTNTGARTFANWQAQYSALKGIASSMGLVMTSNYRGGAKTAGGGYTSLHALGRAVDWSGSASGMSRFFDYIKANYSPTELLYSPKGAGQKNRSSGWHDTSGATKKGHYNHVHLGFAKGGILGQEPVRPYLHDKGGYLQPGLSVLANKTRKPEAVLSDDQWSTAKKAIDNHGGAITINQTISDPGVTSDKIADNVRWELSKNRLRYGN